MSVTEQHLLDDWQRPSLWRRLSAFDWIWAALVAAGALYAHARYHGLMDTYEVAILYATVPALVALGWHFKAIRGFGLAVAVLSLLGVWLYGDDLSRADSHFLLKYLLSSQSAIMWMSALYVAATPVYFAASASRSEFVGKVATGLTWTATTMGMVGLMVRWRESYLISHDVGHIPVSNLYEVFILFSIITALLYLYYEGRYRTRALGGFVLLVISAAVAFLLWYTFDRGAHEIQPLVPALKSYWMKLHVPANFIGYGAFALAAMVAVAWLVRDRARPGGRLAAALPAPWRRA